MAMNGSLPVVQRRFLDEFGVYHWISHITNDNTFDEGVRDHTVHFNDDNEIELFWEEEMLFEPCAVSGNGWYKDINGKGHRIEKVEIYTLVPFDESEAVKVTKLTLMDGNVIEVHSSVFVG